MGCRRGAGNMQPRTGVLRPDWLIWDIEGVLRKGTCEMYSWMRGLWGSIPRLMRTYLNETMGARGGPGRRWRGDISVVGRECGETRGTKLTQKLLSRPKQEDSVGHLWTLLN